MPSTPQSPGGQCQTFAGASSLAQVMAPAIEPPRSHWGAKPMREPTYHRCTATCTTSSALPNNPSGCRPADRPATDPSAVDPVPGGDANSHDARQVASVLPMSWWQSSLATLPFCGGPDPAPCSRQLPGPAPGMKNGRLCGKVCRHPTTRPARRPTQ